MVQPTLTRTTTDKHMSGPNHSFKEYPVDVTFATVNGIVVYLSYTELIWTNFVAQIINCNVYFISYSNRNVWIAAFLPPNFHSVYYMLSMPLAMFCGFVLNSRMNVPSPSRITKIAPINFLFHLVCQTKCLMSKPLI